MPKIKSWVSAGFGERLRQSRTSAGLSQRQLAVRTRADQDDPSTGLTAAYISRLEDDARVPTIDAVWTIADALGNCDREWLRTGTQNEDAGDAAALAGTVRRQYERIRTLEARIQAARAALNEGGSA